MKSLLEAVSQFGFGDQVFALRSVGAVYVPGFEQIGNSIVAGLERKIALASPLRDHDHVARVSQPLLEAVRVSQRQMTAPERNDCGVRIVKSTRHLDGLLTKSDASLALRPVQLESESGEHLRAQGTVALAQHLLRLAEQQDETAIGHPGIAEAASGRYDGAGEQLWSVDTARDIGGRKTRLAGHRKIARLALSLAEFTQQFSTQQLVPAALERQRVDGVAQMMRRFLVGELLFCGASGPPRVSDREIRVVGRCALTIVIGDLGIWLCRPLETADRFGDDPMQTAALGRR